LDSTKLSHLSDLLFFSELAWLYLLITLSIYLTTLFSNSYAASDSKEGVGQQKSSTNKQYQSHRSSSSKILIRSIKNESEFLLKNLYIPEDCNIIYNKGSLFRYTKTHVLEKGISSRDAWQTDFFFVTFLLCSHG
jgi:hypothetical protein